MFNQEARQAAKAAGACLRQAAEGLGMTDRSFSGKPRHALPEGTRRQALEAIKKPDALEQGGEAHD